MPTTIMDTIANTSTQWAKDATLTLFEEGFADGSSNAKNISIPYYMFMPPRYVPLLLNQ